MLFRKKPPRYFYVSLATFLTDFPHHSDSFFDWACIFNCLLYCYIISSSHSFLVISLCLHITYFLLKETAFLISFLLQVLFAFLNFLYMELFPLEKPHLPHACFPSDLSFGSCHSILWLKHLTPVTKLTTQINFFFSIYLRAFFPLNSLLVKLAS